jgi:hypothetical protein
MLNSRWFGLVDRNRKRREALIRTTSRSLASCPYFRSFLLICQRPTYSSTYYICTVCTSTYFIVWLIKNYYCTCCLYGAVRNGFEVAKIHYERHWKGVGTWKSILFWAQKSRDFQGPPIPVPLNAQFSTFFGSDRVSRQKLVTVVFIINNHLTN